MNKYSDATTEFLNCDLLQVNYISIMLIFKTEKRDNLLKSRTHILGLPWWRSDWESACQCRAQGFEPWSGKIPHATEQLSPCATTTEPASHNHWSLCAQSLCSTTKPPQWEARAPQWRVAPARHNLEKARAQQQRPNTAKNKLNFKKELVFFAQYYEHSVRTHPVFQF